MDDSDVVQQKTEAVKGKIEKLIQNKYFIFIVLYVLLNSFRIRERQKRINQCILYLFDNIKVKLHISYE